MLSMAGTYRDTFNAVNGCDSFIVLNLSIKDTFQTVIDSAICRGEVVDFNSQMLSTAGTYRDTFPAVNGCDSFIVLNLSIKDTFQTVIDSMICQGDTIVFNAQDLYAAGTYRDTLGAVNGCDSFIVLNLSIKDTFQTVIDSAICRGEVVEFNSQLLSVAGTYRDTLGAVNGCDSFIVLNLSIKDTFQTVIDSAICRGEVVEFNNLMLSTAGTYRDTLGAMNGCDSFIVLNLSIKDTFQTVIDSMICRGEVVGFNSQMLSVAGTYRDTLGAMNGCDSFIVLNLSIKDTFQTVIDSMICRGEVVDFNGQLLSMAGTYRDTLGAVNGCDSFIVLNLSIKDTFQTVIDSMICRGDTIVFNAQELYSAGTYRDTLGAVNGCDSFIVLNLSIKDTFQTVIDSAICRGEVVDFNSQMLSMAGHVQRHL